MSSPEPWSPKGSDPIADARRIRTNPDTGAIRLRNLSNRFWGNVSAWGILLLAVVLFNRTFLTGEDPMAATELLAACLAMFAVSLMSHMALARTYVEILGEHIRVRNPIRSYSFRLDDIESIEDGFLGFPGVKVCGRHIQLMGMQESLYVQLQGGSMDRGVLEAAVREGSKSIPSEALPQGIGSESKEALSGNVEGRVGIRVSWDLMDPWVLLLMTAWGVFAVSFFV